MGYIIAAIILIAIIFNIGGVAEWLFTTLTTVLRIGVTGVKICLWIILIILLILLVRWIFRKITGGDSED